MVNYEYLFTTTLHQKLKEIIKGKVFCAIKEDHLYVSIETKEIGKYEYTINSSFADDLIRGQISTDNVAEVVVREYRSYVIRQFLK